MLGLFGSSKRDEGDERWKQNFGLFKKIYRGQRADVDCNVWQCAGKLPESSMFGADRTSVVELLGQRPLGQHQMFVR
jgi:hypothetical protein